MFILVRHSCSEKNYNVTEYVSFLYEKHPSLYKVNWEDPFSFKCGR